MLFRLHLYLYYLCVSSKHYMQLSPKKVILYEKINAHPHGLVDIHGILSYTQPSDYNQ